VPAHDQQHRAGKARPHQHRSGHEEAKPINQNKAGHDCACRRARNRAMVVPTIVDSATWSSCSELLLVRAREQDAAQAGRWVATDHPELERKAKEEDALILWRDETGVITTANVTRGYAPEGWMPEVRMNARRVTRPVISATLRHRVHFVPS